jgi:hypothetical protein
MTGPLDQLLDHATDNAWTAVRWGRHARGDHWVTVTVAGDTYKATGRTRDDAAAKLLLGLVELEEAPA